MNRFGLPTLRTAFSPLLVAWIGGCGRTEAPDDVTFAGPSVLSPALDPTYEGRTIDEWVAALGSKEAADRYAALLALAEFRDEAATHRAAIEARLGDAASSVRWSALETLGRLGEAATASAKPVVERLDDEDAGVRRAAARAITRLGVVAVEPLKRRLLGDDPTVAEDAADLLVLIGLPAVGALASTSEDPRTLTAVTAIQSIARLGAVAGATGAAALERAASRKGDVRTTALDALAALGETGVAALRRLATSTDAHLADAAKLRLLPPAPPNSK